jgi:hypothetical protein
MANVCESCGEAYPDGRRICSNDGHVLAAWSVATQRGRGQGLNPPAGPAVPAASDPEPRDQPGVDLTVGRLLSERYLLVQQIGVGGFGVVFRARDRRLGKRVAIKVLSPHLAQSPRAAARFRQEAFAASLVGHPGIVNVTDFDTDPDGTRFLVMEYLEGRDLASVIDDDGAIAPSRALEIVMQVAEAIGAAHEKGIIHRDLKPANIFLVPRPELPDQIKVLDFGISKMITHGDPANALTGVGQILGTPHYLSPEQANGDAVIDGRADIYSLGVILYELLCGETPFQSSSYLGMITQHLVGKPRPPSERVAGGSIPPALDALVLRALEKDPARRFQSMGELGAALTEVAGHLGEHRARATGSDTPPAPAGRGDAAAATDPNGKDAAAPETEREWQPRHSRRLTALAAAGVVVLAAGALWAARQRGSRDPGAPPGRAVIVAAPEALTSLGGCPFSPAFLDGQTLAFEWSRGDDRRHLYRLPFGGAALSRLTTGTLDESDVALGRRPGEILYRVEDPEAQARVDASHFILRDLATGAETPLDVTTTSAVAVGDAIFYARIDHGEIRQRRGQSDEVFLSLPGERTVGGLTGAPDQRWLALTSSAGGMAPALCLVNLVGAPRLRCLAGPRPIRGRVAFSPDSGVLYYPSADGIHRVDLATERDDTAVPGALARAGLTISPRADALVFSDCHAEGPLLDLSRSPPRVAVDEELPREPVGGPGGLLAYVREHRGRHALVVRDAQGMARELAAPGQGSPSSPSFDPTGRWIAFELGGGSSPGIYVMDAAGHYPAEPLTATAHDSAPIWTADGRVAFTRWDDQQNPSVMLVDRGGGTPQRAPLGSRKTVAYALGTGELLLESKDKERLYLWRPGQAQDRPVPLGPLAGSYFMASGISPDARFLVVQTGSYGRVVWRLWLDGSGRPPERLLAAGRGQSMSSVAVMSDGRILVGVRSWRGELHLARAPAGSRF